MRDALEQFLVELRAARRFSPHTIAAYRRDVTHVLNLAARGHRTEAELAREVEQGRPALAARPVASREWTRELLERAMRDLYRTGHSATSSARALAAWRSFGRFLVRRGVLSVDPARALAFPRRPKRLPVRRAVPAASSAHCAAKHSSATVATERPTSTLDRPLSTSTCRWMS